MTRKKRQTRTPVQARLYFLHGPNDGGEYEVRGPEQFTLATRIVWKTDRPAVAAYAPQPHPQVIAHGYGLYEYGYCPHGILYGRYVHTGVTLVDAE